SRQCVQRRRTARRRPRTDTNTHPNDGRLALILARPPTPSSTLFPYTTLFRSKVERPRDRRHAPSICDHLPGHLGNQRRKRIWTRSEEHTSELQSRGHLVCRLLLEKKNQSDLPEHYRSPP